LHDAKHALFVNNFGANSIADFYVDRVSRVCPTVLVWNSAYDRTGVFISSSKYADDDALRRMIEDMTGDRIAVYHRMVHRDAMICCFVAQCGRRREKTVAVRDSEPDGLLAAFYMCCRLIHTSAQRIESQKAVQSAVSSDASATHPHAPDHTA